jgi:hypothetical protein
MGHMACLDVDGDKSLASTGIGISSTEVLYNNRKFIC